MATITLGKPELDSLHGMTGQGTLNVPMEAITLPRVPQPVEIQIFADGNLRKSVAESLNQPAPSGEDGGTDGVARLGISRLDPNNGTTWSGLVSVASTLKPVKGDFIAGILMPGVGSGFHAAMLEFRKQAYSAPTGRRRGPVERFLFSDWRVYGSVAAGEWDSSGSSIRALTFGLGLLRVFTPVRARLSNTDIGLAIEVGPCWRSVGGDVTLSRHRMFLNDSLGTTDRRFFGLEVGMQVRVKDITAGIQLYRFNKGDAEVPGLTRTQLIASVNVRSALFGGKDEG